MVDRYSPRIAVPRALVAIPQTSGGALVAQGVANLASAAEQLAAERVQARAQADDAIAFAQATARYETGLRAIEREEEGRAGVGGSGYVGAVQARRDELRQQVLSGLPSYVTEIGQARIQQAFGIADIDSSARSAEWADAQNQAWRTNALQEVVSTHVGGLLRNPDQALDARASVLDLIERSGLPPDERQQARRSVTASIATAAVEGFLKQGRLEEAFDLIEGIENDLDPDEQIRLDGALQSWAAGAGQEAYQDQLNREVSSLLYGPSRDLDRAITFLETNRDRMSADDYRQNVSAWRTLSEGGSTADAFNLQYEQDLVGLIQSDQLSASEIDTLIRDGLAQDPPLFDEASVNRIRSAQEAREDQTLKAGLDIIQAQLGQSTWDFQRGAQARAEADAKDALYAWRRANPNASRGEVREATDRIVAEQHQIYLGELGPVGSYGVPTELADLDTNDPTSVAGRILADINAGAISAVEAGPLLDQLEDYERRLRVEAMQ